MLPFLQFILALTFGTVLVAPTNPPCAPRLDAPSGAWATSQAMLPSGSRATPDGIALVRGIACRADLAIDDGIIELELAPSSNGFAGIAFRMSSAADYEIIYFRAGADGRWAGVQYQPVYEGETTWQLYPGDGYEADLPAHVATTGDGWTKVRLVIAGRRADLYVGNDATPALRVRELKRTPARGPIALWAATSKKTTSATATIRALRVRPLEGVTLAPVRADTASAGQLTRWRVSRRFAAPDSVAFADTLSSEARRAAHDGGTASAEPSGLVSLTAFVGNPAGPQVINVFGGAAWGVAYANVTLHSDRAQTRRLSLSYSEAIGVYLDGALVYVGDNRYEARAKGQLGVVGWEGETVPLHLHPGDNDIVLAIADKAFGWGFRARLDSLTAVQMVP
jgi:hypothetical protein